MIRKARLNAYSALILFLLTFATPALFAKLLLFPALTFCITALYYGYPKDKLSTKIALTVLILGIGLFVLITNEINYSSFIIPAVLPLIAGAIMLKRRKK